MDIRQLNKIPAAVLVSGIVFLTAGVIGDLLVRVPAQEKLAIRIEPPPPPAPPAAAGGQVAPIGARLAKADPAAGLAYAKTICLICHTATQGGPAIVGPNLYNVVGAPHAHMQGFAYSEGMKAKTGDWSYEALDSWLTKPAAYVPGTKMAFPGIADPQLRANVIAWLRSLSPNPLPLP